MGDKLWKADERRVCRFFGCERSCNGEEDCETDKLCIEVKHRRSLPKWIIDGLRQAIKYTRGGRVPILVLRENHMRIDESLVVIRAKDLKKIADV